MSDDKKFTLDDILEEYKDKDASRYGENNADGSEDTAETVISEQEAAEDVPQETEYDNYEDGEEQDISVKFSPEPMFAPAELFDSEVPKDADMTVDEEEEKEEETVSPEDITLDDDEDIPEDTSEEELIAEEVPAGNDDTDSIETEEIEIEEPKDQAAATWEENGLPHEITAAEIAPEIMEKETETAENDGKTVEIPETSESISEISEEISDAEDVNDRWIIRFLKGIFPVKGDSIGEIIRKIIFLAALIVFIGAGVMLISTLIQSKAAQEVKEQVKSVITTTVATYIDEDGNVQTVAPTEEEIAQHNFDVAEYFKKINKDYVGYLEVEGCDIHEPVVQGKDNDYYLKVNISGGYNKAGTVFMDYRCTADKDYISPNIVLYGHNQEDGTMFGNLKEYKQNVEFYREHPVVNFNTEYESGVYLIYGFFVTTVYENQDSDGEVFHYHDYIETLNDERTFNWYLNEIQERNQIISPVDVKFGDKLLCLSTCSNEFTDSRFVVFARKLRDGESVEDYDFSSAYMNPNAEGVDWDAIMSADPNYEPEVIGSDEEEEAFTGWEKSIGKSNSGNGAKNRKLSISPPEQTEAETTVPEEETTVKKSKKTETETSETEETTKKKSKKTETETSETEETTKKKSKKTEAVDTETSISETESSDTDDGAVTEPPPEEEGSETETAV